MPFYIWQSPTDHIQQQLFGTTQLPVHKLYNFWKLIYEKYKRVIKQIQPASQL